MMNKQDYLENLAFGGLFCKQILYIIVAQPMFLPYHSAFIQR